MTRLSALFVNYNSWRLCVDALLSLRNNPPTTAEGAEMEYEVIVVDNCSRPDPEAEADLEKLVNQLGGKLIRNQENAGYARGMNLGLQHATGDWILVSNPDVLFQPHCLPLLLRHLETHPDTGAAAPMGYWDTTLQGRLPPNILPTLKDLWALTLAGVSPRATRRYSERRTWKALPIWEAEDDDVQLEMLSGCCFLMARKTIDDVGFFDDGFPLYFEDTDLSKRLCRRGLKIVQVGGAKLVHFYNRSGQTDMEETMSRYWISRRRFYRKWYGVLGGLFYDACRWFLGTRWAKARAALPKHEVVHDLGSGSQKPTIHLGRPRERFLVELALDPNFFLAAAMFGSGDSWTPGDELFSNFGETSYFFRVVDLTTSPPQQIGIYRYEMIRAAANSSVPLAAEN